MGHSKELREALKGLLALMALLAADLKDGAQLADAASIMDKIKSNPELQAKLVEAYKGINEVPQELKEIKALDILAIIQDVSTEFMTLLHALKK